MEHDVDEEKKVCRRCGLGKAMLIVLGNPPCGAIQAVPETEQPTIVGD